MGYFATARLCNSCLNGIKGESGLSTTLDKVALWMNASNYLMWEAISDAHADGAVCDVCRHSLDRVHARLLYLRR